MDGAIFPSLIVGSRDKMPKVFHDTGRQETLTVVIKI